MSAETTAVQRICCYCHQPIASGETSFTSGGVHWHSYTCVTGEWCWWKPLDKPATVAPAAASSESAAPEGTKPWQCEFCRDTKLMYDEDDFRVDCTHCAPTQEPPAPRKKLDIKGWGCDECNRLGMSCPAHEAEHEAAADALFGKDGQPPAPFDPTFNCPTHFAAGDPSCAACISKQPPAPVETRETPKLRLSVCRCEKYVEAKPYNFCKKCGCWPCPNPHCDHGMVGNVGCSICSTGTMASEPKPVAPSPSAVDAEPSYLENKQLAASSTTAREGVERELDEFRRDPDARVSDRRKLANAKAQVAALRSELERWRALADRYYAAMDIPFDPDAPIALDRDELVAIRLKAVEYGMESLTAADIGNVATLAAARPTSGAKA